MQGQQLNSAESLALRQALENFKRNNNNNTSGIIGTQISQNPTYRNQVRALSMPNIFTLPVRRSSGKLETKEGIQIKDAASDLGSYHNMSSNQVWQGNDDKYYDATIPQMRSNSDSIALNLFNPLIETGSELGGDMDA